MPRFDLPLAELEASRRTVSDSRDFGDPRASRLACSRQVGGDETAAEVSA